MSAIADSCAVIVFLQDPNAQSRMPNAYPYMASRTVYVPPMVVWEISRKVASGKLPPFPAPLPVLLRQHGFDLMPMTWEVAELAETLPLHHKDPVDRLLVAHARMNQVAAPLLGGGTMMLPMPVLTSDPLFRKYGVPTIW